MIHLKSFITGYSKVYIGLVTLIWTGFFFVPWGSPVLGVTIEYLQHSENLASFWNSVHYNVPAF